jgi:hypothetical protein
LFDKFHEECGVVGVFGHPEAATLAYLSLYALQQRGQESAGIVASNGEALISHRGMGLVADIFDEDILGRLKGRLAIGHNPLLDERLDGPQELPAVRGGVGAGCARDRAQRQPW